MKKKLSVFLAVLLIFCYALSGAASAGVNISVSVSGGGTGTVGDPAMTLTAEVYSSAADLEYSWYSSAVNNIASINAVGASGSSYTPPQTVGTRYYCVAVRSASRSGWVYSQLVPVTYNNGTIGLNIISRPYKWQYNVGDTVDLNGLAVEVTGAGGTWTSYNGADLMVSPTVLNAQGEVVITVSYDGYSDSFGVTVSPHTHSYAAWVITKNATCNATGIRSRSCICGATQTETVPKTAHSWNAGTVTNGVKTYTCKVCGTTKTETVTAVSPSPSVKPSPTPTPAAGTAGTVGTAGGTGVTGAAGGTGLIGVTDGTGTTGTTGTAGTAGTTGGTDTVGTAGTGGTDAAGAGAGLSGTAGGGRDTGGFKWWIIPLVAASVGVIAGGGAYMYLTFVKKE